MDGKYRGSGSHWNSNISGSGRHFLKKESNGSRPSSFSSADLDYLVDMCSDVDELDITPRLSPSPPQPQSVGVTDTSIPSKHNDVQSLNHIQRDIPALFTAGIDRQQSTAQYVMSRTMHSQPYAPATKVKAMPVEVNIVRVGTKFHMIPTSEDGNNLLANIMSNSNGATEVSVTIVSENRQSSTTSERTQPTSSLVSKSASVTNPKHIYKTSCDTFRVQMSKGSKANPNGKFSRNARHELDAFWLCEFALIMMDRPSDFNDLLKNGNFKCMLERGMVSTPHDYAQQLKTQFSRLCNLNLLKPSESAHIVQTLRQYLPGLFDAVVDKEHVPSDNRRQLLTAMSKGSFSDMDHKKRRKSPHSLADLTSQYVLEKRNSRKDVLGGDTVTSAIV